MASSSFKLWFPMYESSEIKVTTNKKEKTKSYVWGASVVEIFLCGHIQLWEQCYHKQETRNISTTQSNTQNT